MSWIDGPTWDRHRGRELVDLLAQQYPGELETRKILDDSGNDRGLLIGGVNLTRNCGGTAS